MRSSEIGPVTAYDQSIIWQIMTDYLQAAAILGIDDASTKNVKATLAELETPRIGKDGSILEWGIDDLVAGDPPTATYPIWWACIPVRKSHGAGRRMHKCSNEVCSSMLNCLSKTHD